MFSQPKDTNPKIEELIISLTRKLSVSEKFSQVRSLSRTVMNLSYRAIKRENPGLNENEIDYLFIKYNHGKNLADRLKKFLQDR